MGYSGDRDMYCNKCKKKMKHVRCPNCKGNPPAFTRCSWCGNSGYKCSNGANDRYHG
jgi:hypothetical protein